MDKEQIEKAASEFSEMKYEISDADKDKVCATKRRISMKREKEIEKPEKAFTQELIDRNTLFTATFLM